ncbi:hypothetical protein [Mucilaginibacter sp.]|uniref:XAC2610-related protein n=1 Tax=Mucilaginibacter sp. TaxID=1882438 RepID=UPI0025F9B184|nr:hypothetical protein [Mucilaginibacter sp.]
MNQDKKIQQRISFNTGLLFEDAYTSNKNARSYVTGVNKDTEVSDYDFGDLIIADLNFDEKEDIAIKYDSGGNGGPVYNFYLQDKTGNFKLSKYLTNRVCSFPFYIDNRHKTIATQIHANVSQEGRKTFKYNPLTKKWRLVKWEMIGTKE